MTILRSLLIMLVLCIAVFAQEAPPKGKPVQVAINPTTAFYVYPEGALRISDTIIFDAQRVDLKSKASHIDVIAANCRTRYFMVVLQDVNSIARLAPVNSAMSFALDYLCKYEPTEKDNG